MTHLKAGDPAPDFDAKDHNGNRVHLGSLKGQKVVLFFYPWVCIAPPHHLGEWRD